MIILRDRVALRLKTLASLIYTYSLTDTFLMLRVTSYLANDIYIHNFQTVSVIISVE